MVDDVGALGEHFGSGSGAHSGITEGVGIVLQHGSVGVGSLDTGNEANAEQVHGLRDHALDIADGTGLGHGAGNDTHQVGALLLGKHQAGHVGKILVGVVVDDGELLIGVGLGSLTGSTGQHKADGDDQVVLLVDEGLDVGSVISVGLALQVGDLKGGVFLGQSLQAFPGALVEGLVVDTARVGDHADLQLGAGRCFLAAAGSQAQNHDNSQQQSNDFLHVHVVFPPDFLFRQKTVILGIYVIPFSRSQYTPFVKRNQQQRIQI